MRAAPELERERGAEILRPREEPAPVVAMPDRLAELPEMQRARAVSGLGGNAVAARALGRVGQTCKCGGTIGPDGQCDKCRAMRAAGLEPEGEEGEADLAISRMLSAAAAARGVDGGLLLRRDDDTPADAAEPECSGTRCGGIPGECPPPFCCPFPFGTATIIRDQIRLPFLAAIGSQVTASVVPVWLTWFNGGSSVQNFTGRFGAEFQGDPTTTAVSAQLASDVAADIDATRLQALAATATPGVPVSLVPALPGGYLTTKTRAMERRHDPLEMDFTTIGTAPGNLAGGVGKTQTTCSVGATPSPVDDARELLDVQGTMVRNPDGSISVSPTFSFKVTDTVDLCPGNCGSGLGMINEQLATFPMSRLEASGVSGDVPFFVEFGARSGTFLVPPPAPPKPQHVVVSASTLFDFNSHALKSGGEDALVAELGDRPAQADLTQPFTVEGHTDSKGSDEVNQPLSEARAATVVEVLERRYPNVAGHLGAVGFGETRPIAPNEIGGVDNPAGRAQNRRVEMHFSAPPAP